MASLISTNDRTVDTNIPTNMGYEQTSDSSHIASRVNLVAAIFSQESDREKIASFVNAGIPITQITEVSTESLKVILQFNKTILPLCEFGIPFEEIAEEVQNLVDSGVEIEKIIKLTPLKFKTVIHNSEFIAELVSGGISFDAITAYDPDLILDLTFFPGPILQLFYAGVKYSQIAEIKEESTRHYICHHAKAVITMLEGGVEFDEIISLEHGRLHDTLLCARIAIRLNTIGIKLSRVQKMDHQLYNDLYGNLVEIEELYAADKNISTDESLKELLIPIKSSKSIYR